MGGILVIMPQFILKINLGNDAMQSNMDVGIAIKQIGDKIIYEGCGKEKHNIRDNNGNTVGSYQVVNTFVPNCKKFLNGDVL